MAANDVLQEFTGDRCQGDRAVVFGKVLVTFFEYQSNTCPGLWETSCVDLFFARRRSDPQQVGTCILSGHVLGCCLGQYNDIIFFRSISVQLLNCKLLYGTALGKRWTKGS